MGPFYCADDLHQLIYSIFAANGQKF
jgi:hypothetical protein